MAYPTVDTVALLVDINGLALGTVTNPIRFDPTGTTVQPISGGGGGAGGTVIQGAPGTLLLAWPVKVTDGINVQPTGDAAARSIHVTVDNGTIAVTGTFFQATQPVSGSVSVSNFPATQPVSGTVTVIQGTPGASAWKVDGSAVTQPVSGTFFQATQPVSGTFFQATQPVSGTVTANAGTGTFNTTDGNAIAQGSTTSGQKGFLELGAVTTAAPTYVTAQSAPLSLTVAGALRVDSSAVTQPVSFTPPTLTKGTQGATGYSVQDLKDAGRVLCSFTASAVAGVTAEALITLTPYKDLVAGGTGTTFAVTAGKRLRLQTIVVTWRNNTAAAGGVTVRLRMLAGTVLVGSPVQGSVNATTSLATIGSGTTATMILPDGLELSGTMQFGLTQISVGAVVGFDVHVIGYEY